MEDSARATLTAGAAEAGDSGCGIRIRVVTLALKPRPHEDAICVMLEVDKYSDSSDGSKAMLIWKLDEFVDVPSRDFLVGFRTLELVVAELQPKSSFMPLLCHGC